MKRVDLLISSNKSYSFEKYMAEQLAHGFKKKGINAEIALLEEEKILHYLKKVEENPPDFLVTFDHTPLLKNFCELVQLPHFYWEVRSLAESLHTLQNPRTKMGYADRLIPKKIVDLQKSLFFLPPACSPFSIEPFERPYEIVFFDDLVDCNCLEATWEEMLQPEVVEALYRIVGSCQKNPNLLPFEAILSEKEIGIGFNDLLYLVEEYMKAKSFLPMLQSISGRRIDVFGEHIGNNWLRKLPNGNSVYLHSSLPYSAPYTDHLDVLNMSKMIIRDQYLHRDGCDEWVFEAIRRGCFVVTSHTPFLEEALTAEALFFKRGDLFTMKEKVDYYLDHPKERDDLLLFLQEKVGKYHTFESRAESIMKVML